jgi:hypothetical protein
MDALAGRLAAASVSDHPSSSSAAATDGANADHLLHVMRAVEGAEATIRNQVYLLSFPTHEPTLAIPSSSPLPQFPSCPTPNSPYFISAHH